jgi:hypothetical protein
MDAHQPIRALIAQVRRRWRTGRLFHVAALAAVLASVTLIAAYVAARWADGSPVALTATGMLALLILGGLIGWAAALVRRGPSDRQLARFIEERVPSLEDRLVTAVDVLGRLDDGEQSTPAFARLMLADAAAAAGAVDLDAVVPWRDQRGAGLRAVAALVVLGAVAVVAGGTARRMLDAALLVAFPSRVQLEVRPGNARVLAGAGFAIVAGFNGGRAPLTPRVEIDDRGQWRSAGMAERADGRFELALPSVSAPFTYRVTAGTLVSSTYAVTVVRPPGVARIDIDYTYPAALGLPPRSEEDGGDIYAPAGTDVRVRVHTDRPVAQGRLAFAGGASVPLAAEGSTALSAALKVTKDGSYRVSLTDGEGLSNPGDTEYFVRVLEDRPPEVHVTKPAGDRSVSRLEEVDIEAEADDDYGLERLELVYAVRGGSEKVVLLSAPRRATSTTGRYTMYLEDLDVAPGDFVSYYVRAKDLKRGGRSNEARSDIFFLDVRPFEQEFSLAESQSMAGSGYNGAVDELVNAQRQVVVATWKLDRRAQTASGARSEKDVRSVGRTEADLRLRVERTASSFRESTMRDPRQRLPGGGARGSGAARPEENAMAAAAEAMGRAVAALDALRTASALPPEMEALNHLLKAQAAIRHRQIAMDQSGAGAAGNNNRNFDVSTLFDRELRRQQQTSYETRASAENRQQPGSNPLDRIKDLARRQDELLRRQQDLARAEMSGEERARQLEKLTRDQSELRQRAEELSREMTDQRGRPGSEAASTQADMQDVSEDMRRAAGELRRGAPDRAGSSAGRALEKLRALEQRLRTGTDERRRAVGEMQLEARQLADEQRQIAAELGRLAANQAVNDAMRKLAGQQDALAERARQLQQNVERQAAAPRDRPTDADRKEGIDVQVGVSDAARQLAEQHLSERMKELADRMRQAGQGNSGAPRAGSTDERRTQAIVQQDLARELDRFAERLSGSSRSTDNETRRLSEQLGRAQELRDKLDRASRALEAAGGQRAGTRKAPGESGRTGEGRQGAGGTDVSELTEESLKHLREAQRLTEELGRDDPSFSRSGLGFTLEGQGMVWSAPGTEAFKQDFARWEVLKRQAILALEQAESTVAGKLRAQASKDRLSAGIADKPPPQYEKQVDSYFKALASKKPRD